MNGDSEASKDVSNCQSTQNQVFKVHFFAERQPKMKHRLQGDKKTLASLGREPELILAQLWGRPSLAGGVLCV